MKKIFVILFTIAFHFSYAQRVDIANPEKSFQRTFSKVIGQTERGFYLLKSQNAFNNKQDQLRLRDNKIEVAFIENNLSTKWSTPIILAENNAEIQDIQFFSDSLFIFYVLPNKELNRFELFAQTIDLKTGYTNPNNKKMVDYMPIQSRNTKGLFFIRKSKDSKTLCTMYKYSNADDEKLDIHIGIHDSTLNTKWEKLYKTGQYDGVLFLNDFVVSNEGNVYLLSSLDLDKKALRDKKYTINLATEENNKLKSIPLLLEKNFISDIRMELDIINNQLIIAGFYSEMNSNSSAGIFYASMKFNTEEVLVKTESFKAKFLNSFNTERTVNRGTELINYYIDKIILRTDGGVIIIAESNYVTESTNYNSYYQLYTTSYTYHYDNILIFSINPNGKIHWESIIQKNQVSEDDAAFYSSYILLLDADRLHLIFNKFIRKSTDIVSFTINNKGESFERIILKENDNILLMPGGGKQISADQIVIPCIQKNKTNFIRISY